MRTRTFIAGLLAVSISALGLSAPASARVSQECTFYQSAERISEI